jgi:RNA polymerase sigma factor for flagellar operon FliA
MSGRSFRWPFPSAGRSIGPEAIEAAWREYRARRSEAARDTLLQRYIHLVRYMASRVSRALPPSIDVDDLISAGVIGFLAALDGYDPKHGTDFSVYALTRIRGAMVDFVREIDPIGRVTRRRLRQAEQTLNQLEQQLSRPPTDEEAARHLGMSIDAYHALMAQGAAAMTLSLDHVETDGEDEGDPVVRARIADPAGKDALTHLVEKESASDVAALVAALSASQQLVLHLHYVEELNFREIGMVMDISESRAGQLHTAAVLALRRARLAGSRAAGPRAAQGTVSHGATR